VPTDDECIARPSVLLEDPVLAGDVEGIGLRRAAMVEVLALRGPDAGMLLN
jgi:hypothetical protein